jgi:hypothetical protein
MTDLAEADKEQRGHAAGSALELVSHAYLALEFDASDSIEEFDLDYALDVKNYLQAVRRAASEIEKQVDAYVAAQLKPATYYRHRDSVVKVGGSGAWKVKEETVNDGRLAKFIGSDWPLIVNLKASGAVTKSRIEALAQERIGGEFVGVGRSDETAEYLKQRAAEAMRHEFFEYKRNENAISVMRPEDAPKYAQALSEGERYIPKPKKPKAIEA